jgi:hypothetical protein
MNRRQMLKFTAAQTAMVAVTSTVSGSFAQGQAASNSTALTLRNAEFELVLRHAEGLQCRLVHRATGAVLADGSYHYSCGRPSFAVAKLDQHSVSYRAQMPSGLTILHNFHLDPAAPWTEEQIELSNTGSLPFDLHDLRLGFVLPLKLAGGKVTGGWERYTFFAVPFRREPGGYMKEYMDFTAEQVLTEACSSQLWSGETTATSNYASEAWALSDGTHGLLISKYSQNALELSILDRARLAGGEAGLIWGGVGVNRGRPQHGAWLNPGETHRFGVTRLTAYQGDWQQGFYTFRDEMEKRGHGCPQHFNPPVHWNELYDNKLWWLPGDEQNNPEMRKKYYTVESMKEEAAKAKAIGCEALYMDPGWDVSFGSFLWDSARLGPYKSFVDMLQQDYGLKSSLHTPLSGWCDPSSWPEESYRLDRFGRRRMWDRSTGFLASPICGASNQYIDTAAQRLRTLAVDGAAFFMFDGTLYHEECWDPNHGHQVPARLEEHEQARSRLARMVHEKYADVLIEMHNPSPIYFGHGDCAEGEGACGAHGFDVVWAFELMWKPMDDLLSGHSVALYYYNLAYSLPLYIHIDLRTDNENALVFWWNASTCRHLGIGGTHPNAVVRQAQKDGMANYRRLKPYFVSGTFYGIDEQTHVHSAPDRRSAVINCFNLDVTDSEREIDFQPAKLGLLPEKDYHFSNGNFSRSSLQSYRGRVRIPAHGHTLLEVS